MRHAIICLLFCLLPCLAQAQPQPFARSYAGEQGLPSNIVTEVLEDRLGFLWLATGNGLCRFDGYGFSNLHAGAGIPDANVLFLEEDQNGRLWFVTLERNVYYLENDRIRPYPGNARIAQLTQNKGTPHGFLVSPQGDSLFLAVGQSGILAMDSSGNARRQAPQMPANRILLEKDGQAILTQINRPTSSETPAGPRFDFRTGAGSFFCDFPRLKKGEPQGLVTVPVSENALLVSSGARIFFVKDQSWEWYADLPGRPVHIALDDKGAIYLSLLNGGGLRRYASLEALRRGVFTQYAPGLSARWWYAGRRGGWWISTQEQGVLYLPNPLANTFTRFPGLEQNRPYSLALRDDSTAFLGFGLGKVCRLNLRDGAVEALPEVPLSNTLFDLYFDTTSNRLWAATVYAQYLENGRWTAPPFPQDRGIPASRIGPGQRLCLSSQKGLIAIDPGSLEWRSSLGQKDNTGVLHALEDFSGLIWAATPAGLFRWDETGFSPPPLKHPFFSKALQHLALAPDSSLLFSDGVDVFRWKNEDVRNLTREAGVSLQSVSGIVADEKGRIWVNAADQLLLLAPDGESRFFNTAHGILPGRIKDMAYNAGMVWLLGDAGLTALPDDLPPAQPAGVIIESLLVNGQSRTVKAGNRFSWGENDLSFRLLSLNFKTGEQTRYRYRLRPGESWQETANRELRFPSLGEGSYRLELAAQNEDGAWGPALVFPFRVSPPFYRAWWFFGSLAALLLIGGFLIFRYRLREVKKEASLREQISALERSALQAQMNPHFIFNSLNSIQHFVLQNDKQKAGQYLASFARLVRDSLDASVEGKVSLEDEVRMLENYLSLEKMRFKDAFDYSVEVAGNTDPFDIEIPPLLLQPFVENAVLHGMKNASGQGFIRVFFEEKDHALHITVEDNGPGLSAGAKNDSAEPPAHKSVGMGITQKRLALLGGSDNFQIEEIRNAAGEVQGTRVRVKVNL